MFRPIGGNWLRIIVRRIDTLGANPRDVWCVDSRSPSQQIALQLDLGIRASHLWIGRDPIADRVRLVLIQEAVNELHQFLLQVHD